MARSKSIPQRSLQVRASSAKAKQVETVTKRLDGPWSTSLLDTLQSWFEDESNAGERPAKRIRTDPEVVSIPILRDEIKVSAQLAAGSPFTVSNKTHRLDHGVGFTLDSEIIGEVEHDVLTLRKVNAVHKTTTIVEVELENDVLEPLATILQRHYTHRVPWSNPGTEDALWLSADIHTSLSGESLTINIIFTVHWNISTTLSAPRLQRPESNLRRLILATAFPQAFGDVDLAAESASSPQNFYEAACVPEVGVASDDLTIVGLDAKLYPFQRRAVDWLLRREQAGTVQSITRPHGMQISPDETGASSACLKVQDINGSTCYVSHIYDTIATSPEIFQTADTRLKGGILCEEMGLGKTVELLGLILSHPEPMQQSMSPTSSENNLGPKPDLEVPSALTELQTTCATLIVAPNALKDQWLSEIRKHAPGTRVMYYAGVVNTNRDENDENRAITQIQEHEIVVTTYNVLSSELDFALGEPDRARRAPRKYRRPQSPLTRLRWWRVCLDEAQMIESGVTKAATLARLIPRVNAWGVTGTPVKDSAEDLRGLLVFLGYEPFASMPQAWNTLVHSPRGFHRVFNSIALRHTKRLVRHELSIPAQKRYVISMPFTAVEDQHYRSLHEQMAEACGLDTLGRPLNEFWDPDDPGTLERMRTALDRLRQTALHPEVGGRNRRELGAKQGPMSTMDEVLNAMINNTAVTMRNYQRILLTTKLTRGQLLENSPRVREALVIWQDVMVSSKEIVQECRKQLATETAKVRGAIKALDSSDEESEEAESKFVGQLGEAKRRLQLALELQHRAVFFCANAHFQIKSNEEWTEPDSKEFKDLEKLETQGYDDAKQLRHEILFESRGKAKRLLDTISNTARQQKFTSIQELIAPEQRGIESGNIIESFRDLCEGLNEQATKVDEWREHVIQLLLKSLVDEDDDKGEITGEEYDESTKLQDEIMVYVTILRTSISDREELLSGQVNQLTEHEAQKSIRAARNGDGAFPERTLELFDVRDKLKQAAPRGSVRAVIADLRALTIKLRAEGELESRARAELSIASRLLKDIQAQLTLQQKICVQMSQELDKFTAAMNARIEYYRQLQKLSDDVDVYKGTKDDGAMATMMREERVALANFEKMEARYRYLLHLRDQDSSLADQWHCVICQTDFTHGVLTICAHTFCKDCITYWMKAHHNCPICKRALKTSNLHDIALRPKELKVHAESSAASSRDNLSQESKEDETAAIFSRFSKSKLDEIQNIELNGPAFTTKVDNLIRHLLWLRDSDPGAKSIVFSQYQDFLSVLALAFQRYGIGYASFDKPNGITRFKEDPGVECFLLHARAHASGLNLVNASHVFLCEPLVNTALELQAIARVHRIGQESETTVWLYIVQGTVEESIYHLSVRRRMAHMERQDRDGDGKRKQTGKGTAHLIADGDGNDNGRETTGRAVGVAALEAAEAEEMEQASLSHLMSKGKTAGEAVPKRDLWECLFGHVSLERSGEEKRFRNNPVVRAHLAAEAADRRAEEGGGTGGQERLIHGL